MKNEIKISKIAVVCALCTAAVTNAFGAATVRSLGGAGTYTGTSAAAGNASNGVAAVRAGSLRVRPSAVAGTVSAPKTTTNGNAVTSSRLSIGKYLGGVKAPSSGGSNNSGSMNPGVAENGNLQDRIKELEAFVKAETGGVRAELTQDLEAKQDKLTSVDEYIVIEKDEIFLNVDALQNGLALTDGKDGRDVEIGSNETHLLWRYAGDDKWTELIALSAIRGAQGEKGEKGDAGVVDPEVLNAAVQTAVENAGYVTSAEMESAIDLATADLATKSELTQKADTARVNEALSLKATKEELANYAKSSDVSDTYATKEALQQAVIDAKDIDLTGYARVGDSYTKSESDAKYLTEHQSLTDYAKSADVAAALADKADTTTVSGLVERVSGAESAADDAKTAANNAVAALADKADTTTVSGLTERVSDVESVADEAKTAANSAVAELEQKADKSDVYTKGEVDTKVEQVIAGDMTDALKSYVKTSDFDDKMADVVTVQNVNNVVSEQLGDVVTVQNVNNVVSEQLGDVVTVANFNQKVTNVTNANIADDAAIAKEKLATGVQESLGRADDAYVPSDAPNDGDYILAVSDGQKGWFEIVNE